MIREQEWQEKMQAKKTTLGPDQDEANTMFQWELSEMKQQKVKQDLLNQITMKS